MTALQQSSQALAVLGAIASRISFFFLNFGFRYMPQIAVCTKLDGMWDRGLPRNQLGNQIGVAKMKKTTIWTGIGEKQTFCS
jgi:hypothetical protein